MKTRNLAVLPQAHLSSIEIDCGLVEARIKVQSPRCLARARRRAADEGLLSELLALPQEERRELLHGERFRIPELFELVLEAGYAVLPFDPGQAAELTTLAFDLTAALNEREDGDPEIETEVLSRAFCLTGIVRRLLGDPEGAEAAFERAGSLAVSAAARGLFCRALGVLRWDQERFEEAAALFHQARRRFAGRRAAGEAAACLALLGLLHVEEGQIRRAVPFLHQATRRLDGSGRPWLVAHCWLGLAFCFASSGEWDKARPARETAWRFYRDVRQEEALLSLYWLEGRGAALAGDFEDAGHLLDSVRRMLIGRRRLPEATLATIDLGLVSIGAGRGGEVGVLIEELSAAFDGQPGFTLALGALSRYGEDAAAGRIDRELWSFVAPALRMAFRLQGACLRPKPFV